MVRILRLSIFILLIVVTCCLLRKDCLINSGKAIHRPIAKSSNAVNKNILPLKITKNIKLRIQSKLQTNLYKYLLDLNNQKTVKRKSVQLNYGDEHNSCVYFASEALRRVGCRIPKRICYTGQLWGKDKKRTSLINQLRNLRWQESKDLSLLLPGDICFTKPDPYGHPTHVYVFMGWVKNDDYNYAYVCDNQSYDYGLTFHIRNIKNALNDKDALYFFMYE
jgi:hypothetical protein